MIRKTWSKKVLKMMRSLFVLQRQEHPIRTLEVRVGCFFRIIYLKLRFSISKIDLLQQYFYAIMNTMDLGQVFTNEHIANYMVSLFDLQPDARILEPCFGAGAFLSALQNARYFNIKGFEIATNLYVDTKKKFEKFDLINADFLRSPYEQFDGVIMNPPYIRQEKIDTLCYLGITKQSLRADPLYKDLPQNANLYVYFIVKALSQLKPNGQLVVIFPNIWMKAKSGQFLRSLIYENYTVEKHVNMQGKVFDQNALVDVVILKIVKRPPVTYTHVENLFFNGVSLEKKEVTEDICIELPITFEMLANTRRGLTTGYNKFFINPPKNTSCIPILTTPKGVIGYNTDSAKIDRLFYVSDKSTVEDRQHIASYKNEITVTKKPKTLYQKISDSDKWYKLNLIPSKGIIFSYFVRNDVKFILNDNELQVRDNFYIIKPKIDIHLMFALLNNHFTYYQLECLGKRYGSGLLKIQKYDIEKITFPDISFFSKEDVDTLINLSKIIIQTGKQTYVQEITKVISNYTMLSSECIITQYNLLKKQRLQDKK